MSKNEFVYRLEEAGFKPFDEDGVVMIVTPDKLDMSRMAALAKKCGYDNSYGWRLKINKEEKKEEVRIYE